MTDENPEITSEVEEETEEFPELPSAFDGLLDEDEDADDVEEEEADDGANGADTEGVPDDPDELRSLVATQKTEIDRLARAQQGTYEALKKSRQFNKRIDQIEGLLAERVKPAEAPEVEEELPDPEVDPSGYTAKMVERQGKKLDALMADAEKEKTAANQAALLDGVNEWIESSEAVALAADPSYEQASSHWDDVVASQFELVGGDPNDADQLTQHLSVAELQLAQVAKQTGKTVAQIKLAQAKLWGWTPQVVEAAADEEEEEEEPEVEKPVAAKRKASKAKRSKSLDTLLGGASKGGPKPKLKKVLAEASQEEYNAIFDHLKQETGILDEDKLDRMIEEGRL